MEPVNREIMYISNKYVEIMFVFEKSGGNAHEAARMYATHFPDLSHLNHKVILKVISRAQETSQVALDQRHLAVRTVENKVDTIDAFEEDVAKSISKVVRIVKLLKSTIHRIINEIDYISLGSCATFTAIYYPVRIDCCRW